MGSIQLRAAFLLFSLLLVTCLGQFQQQQRHLNLREQSNYDVSHNPFLRQYQQVQQQREQYQQLQQQREQYQQVQQQREQYQQPQQQREQYQQVQQQREQYQQVQQQREQYQQPQVQQRVQYQQLQQQPRSYEPLVDDNRVVCPEPNGRFPVPSQCDAYIECIKGVGEEKLCPDGLLFNPDARFNYPCGYPIDVQCLGRSSRQPAQPTEDCPHQYGYFKVGDRQNCGRFMNCAEGRSYIFDCPEGLAYNSESYRCDWPDQVPDCDAEAFLGFTCPNVNQNQFLSSEVKFYRSPTDCQRYFICVENRPRLQTCGEGHAFNELINACDAAENVTGCEPPISNFQPQVDQPQLIQFNSQQNTKRNNYNS